MMATWWPKHVVHFDAYMVINILCCADVPFCILYLILYSTPGCLLWVLSFIGLSLSRECTRNLYFVDRTFLYNLFQMKPSRCILLLSIFISTSLHVSDNYVPIIRRTYCIYAKLVFFVLYGWLFGLSVSSQPADQTATHTEWKIPVPHRYSKFSWWWAHSCPKHVQNLK